MISARASAAFAALFFSLAACAPKIYLVDRQTILEQEAAGEWPQFEKDLVAKSVREGPEPFGKIPASAEQKRLYNVLNGELVSAQAAPTPRTRNESAGAGKGRGDSP